MSKTLADEMSQLARDYENEFFDPDTFRSIISLIRNAAGQGKYNLRLSVWGSSEMYRSLIRHLQTEGFLATFMYGPASDDGTINPNYIYIHWR
jgi:hypothetical protein